MRTSLCQQLQNSLLYVNKASSRLVDAQNHVASGKRIMRPSDDVSGTSRALSLRSAINSTDQLANNTVVSKPLLGATQNALSDMVKAVRSARDIAVAAANPDFSSEGRAAYATQLNDILGQMADVANTKHMDQYVFSGTATDTAPLVAEAGASPYSYAGDSGTRCVQVLGWTTLPTGVPGSKAFNFDGSAGAGTTDIFTMVAQLRDAVLSGDAKTISGELTNIDANLDNLLTSEAQVGSWIARMDKAASILADTGDRLTTMLSDTEDIDLTQAVVDLKSQENVYQAALAVSSRVLDMSLASLTYYQ